MSGIDIDAHLFYDVCVGDGEFALRITVVYAVVSAVFDVSVGWFTCGTVICVFTAGFTLPIAFTATLSTLCVKSVVEFHASAPVIHYYATEWKYHTWFCCDLRF